MSFNNNTPLSILIFMAVPAVVAIEAYATTNFLGSISYLLLMVIIALNLHVAKNSLAINPYSVFSVMYSGLVVGGLYYSFSNGYFGKFLEFTSLSRADIEHYLVISQIYALICFLFFSFGYILFYKKSQDLKINYRNPFSIFLKKNYIIISSPLLIAGFLYWVWVCNVIAGGIFEALILFQVFPHLIKDAQISTLPYLLYYSGVYIYMMGLIINGKKLGAIFWLLSIAGFIISLSTARVAISVTYLLSQIYLIYLLFPENRKLMVKIILFVFTFSFFVFFLRIASNLYFLGQNVNFGEIEFFKVFIGGGNVTDLQQLVVVLGLLDDYPRGFGLTYFDWVRNTFGDFFGIKPSSIGLIIKDHFVSENSGAPTPTAIGEAFFNFHIAAPFFIFFIGAAFAIIYNSIGKNIGILSVFVYSSFVVNFAFLYPKVDSTMFSNFFWSVAPTLLILTSAYIFFNILKRSCR